jgi:hypothetical protein
MEEIRRKLVFISRCTSLATRSRRRHGLPFHKRDGAGGIPGTATVSTLKSTLRDTPLSARLKNTRNRTLRVSCQSVSENSSTRNRSKPSRRRCIEKMRKMEQDAKGLSARNVPAEWVGDFKIGHSEFLKDADRDFWEETLLTLLVLCIGVAVTGCIKRHTVVDPPAAVTKQIAPLLQPHQTARADWRQTWPLVFPPLLTFQVWPD